MQMDTKQKTLLVVTIAALGYLGYQVYGLVNEDVVQASHATAHHRIEPVQTANAAPVEVNTSPGVPRDAQLKRPPLVTGQKAYLEMVNQYELAKMQRRLLEERAAIAAAQHRIASLNEKTRAMDAQLSTSPMTASEGVTTSMEARYTLSYLDNQHGQWAATLSQSGHYHAVNVGTELPDGAKVLDISRQGVLLVKDKQREWVTFDGIQSADTPSAQPVVENTPVSAPTSQAAPTPHSLPVAPPVKTTEKTGVLNAAAQSGSAAPAPEALPSSISAKQKVVPSPAKQTVTHPSVAATQHKPAVENTPDLVVAVATTVQPTKDAAPAAVAHQPLRQGDAHRILQMSPQSYTIQLIGSSHRDVIENFAIANDLGNKTLQFYVNHDGKRWYMLLYGQYRTTKQALAALKALPPNLTPEHPWIRRVASVQRDLRRRAHRARR